uniref:Transmembrane protein n=1 Tax=Cacopsylla melanoneura TaxID=428564 RepID=A0A8D8UDG7_9HEMI
MDGLFMVWVSWGLDILLRWLLQRSGYRSCGGVNRTVGRWGRNCSTGSRSNGTGSRSNGSRSTGSNSVAGWRRCVAVSITGHFHTFSTSLHAVEFANVGILPTISAAHWGILLRTEASLQTLWIGLSVEVVIVVLVVVIVVVLVLGAVIVLVVLVLVVIVVVVVVVFVVSLHRKRKEKKKKK